MQIRCCVAVSASFTPKARYALQMLLVPLGLDPVWVSRDTLQTGDLYYGTTDTSLPDGILNLPLARHAEAYFNSRIPYKEQQATLRYWDGLPWPVLFPGATPNLDDLVSSAFFWLSGWQEHVISARDSHARFQHRDSLQHTLDITTRPVVDAYRHQLLQQLLRHGIPVSPRQWDGATWALCPTIDVDYVTKWRKGMVYRESVEYLVLNRRKKNAAARLARFGLFLRDASRPGDIYQQALQRILETIRSHGTGTVFLKAAARGPFDVAYSLMHPFLQQYIKALVQDRFEIGLHPSYHAHTHPVFLQEELGALTSSVGETPISIRQHFLRYEVPATPRIQQWAGMRIDSTLGFTEHEGFRHGTCMPFLKFDCAANRTATLWEMPLAVMESALFNRRGLNRQRAREATEEILAQCRYFGGAAVMLWHGVLWDEMDHPGWGKHFTETLAWAAAHHACISSLRGALTAWLGRAP